MPRERAASMMRRASSIMSCRAASIPRVGSVAMATLSPRGRERKLPPGVAQVRNMVSRKTSSPSACTAWRSPAGMLKQAAWPRHVLIVAQAHRTGAAEHVDHRRHAGGVLGELLPGSEREVHQLVVLVLHQRLAHYASLATSARATRSKLAGRSPRAPLVMSAPVVVRRVRYPPVPRPNRHDPGLIPRRREVLR